MTRASFSVNTMCNVARLINCKKLLQLKSWYTVQSVRTIIQNSERFYSIWQGGAVWVYNGCVRANHIQGYQGF